VIQSARTNAVADSSASLNVIEKENELTHEYEAVYISKDLQTARPVA
jgi:hypothetical protein